MIRRQTGKSKQRKKTKQARVKNQESTEFTENKTNRTGEHNRPVKQKAKQAVAHGAWNHGSYDTKGESVRSIWWKNDVGFWIETLYGRNKL